MTVMPAGLEGFRARLPVIFLGGSAAGGSVEPAVMLLRKKGVRGGGYCRTV